MEGMEGTRHADRYSRGVLISLLDVVRATSRAVLTGQLRMQESIKRGWGLLLLLSARLPLRHEWSTGVYLDFLRAMDLPQYFYTTITGRKWRHWISY